MRKTFLLILLLATPVLGAAAPTDDPAARYGLEWTGQVAWDRVVRIDQVEGADDDARFAAARARLAEKGGVIFFPPGEYRFRGDLVLADGVVLRGADPAGVTDARKEGYAPPTRFLFPKYQPTFTGDGTPVATAFKGIYAPATASNCGVVNVAIEYGHVHLAEAEDHSAGRRRIVFGCCLHAAARPDPHVPDPEMGQHGWQRFTARHLAAIHVYSSEDALVAANRLVNSSGDNYVQKGYVLRARGKEAGPLVPARGVVFDYDNRPGLSVNNYVVGGMGGRDPKGTPETHPRGFRTGLLIRENYIYSTGRNAIAFSGDGVVCSFNVIRFAKDVHRFTHTGRHEASGSSTNSNRAVQMRGWRWTLEGNDYEVYRNRVGDTSIFINDGEGLMHEGHANAVLCDSKLLRNRGNAYLSLYKTAGVDGLLIEGNDIRTRGGIAAIYVNADRNWDSHFCRNVRILGNTTAGSGIYLRGSPAEGNVIRGNRHAGPGGTIVNRADARVEDNTGYEVVEE